MRGLKLAGILALAAPLTFLVWLVFPAAPGDGACRAVALRSAGTGAIVPGTEDLALDPERGQLIVSAYDRRTNSPGGLYAVSLAALESAASQVTASPLVLDAPRALRPHGIALAGMGAQRLYVINRIKSKEGRTAELLTLRLDGPGAALERSVPLPCGANDILPLENGAVLVTVDRTVCSGLRRWLADALNLVHGSVVAVMPDGTRRTLAEHIDFANGIAEQDGLIYVAATRARALLVYERKALLEGPAPATPLRRISLSGAPDNISRGADGKLYIAAHRSLFRFAAYLGGVRGDSPGDIEAYDPADGTGAARPLFRLSRILDGPTSAVATNGLVIVGGGFSAGLALCAGRGEARP